RTCTGASMTFSSAVMCGNRLNCWKTMPIRLRICRIRLVSRGRLRASSVFHNSSPSTSTRPEVGCSRVISTRRMVVLPEPDGPMIEILSPLFTEKSSSRRTWLSPQFLLTLSKRTIGSPGVPSSVDGAIAGLQSTQNEGARDADDEEQQCRDGEGLDVAEL